MTGKSGLTKQDKSLAVLFPHTLAFWDYSLNTHDPYLIGAKSNQKVWWKCLDNDGSYYHKDKSEKDIDKTKKLIDLGYLVVRIREQSSTVGLPLLDFEHRNFVQVSHIYNARNKNIEATVQDILDKISAVKQFS